MSSAYLVKYTGPRGVECPDAVVTFGPGHGEDVAELAPLVKAALLDPRCGPEWTPQAINITSMTYLGPWFNSGAEECPKCRVAAELRQRKAEWLQRSMERDLKRIAEANRD
jgi:hypothetical protein